MAPSLPLPRDKAQGSDKSRGGKRPPSSLSLPQWRLAMETCTDTARSRTLPLRWGPAVSKKGGGRQQPSQVPAWPWRRPALCQVAFQSWAGRSRRRGRPGEEAQTRGSVRALPGPLTAPAQAPLPMAAWNSCPGSGPGRAGQERWSSATGQAMGVLLCPL